MTSGAEEGMVVSRGEALATSERIVQAVAACPGINKTELGRHLDLGWGTVDHHVAMLVRQGLIEKVRYGRDLLLAPPDMDSSDVRCLGLLRDELAERVVSKLSGGQEQRLCDIAREVGAPAPVVRKRLVALAGDGLLRRGRVRSRTTYTVIDGALERVRNLQHAGSTPGHPGPTPRQEIVAIDEARQGDSIESADEARPLAHLRGDT